MIPPLVPALATRVALPAVALLVKVRPPETEVS
jgi:hypothetical protein